MHSLEGLENWVPRKISAHAAPVDDGGDGHLSESHFRSREVSPGMKQLSEEKARGQEVSVDYRQAGRHVAQCSSTGNYLTQRGEGKAADAAFPGGVTVFPGRCGLLAWRGRTGWYQIPLSAPDS